MYILIIYSFNILYQMVFIFIKNGFCFVLRNCVTAITNDQLPLKGRTGMTTIAVKRV